MSDTTWTVHRPSDLAAKQLEEARDELARERARGDSLERKIRDLHDEREALLEGLEAARIYRAEEAHREAARQAEIAHLEDLARDLTARLDRALDRRDARDRALRALADERMARQELGQQCDRWRELAQAGAAVLRRLHEGGDLELLREQDPTGGIERAWRVLYEVSQREVG